MTTNNLTIEYFNWLCKLVSDRQHTRFKEVLKLLHEKEFIYIIDMDGNRYEDGIELRYRFAYECGHDYRIIASCLDTRPCSILEMMIALALRCEEHIMDDYSIGNRTAQWFWDMMNSLGLGRMDDIHVQKDVFDEIIDTFLNRNYAPNGKGGLFTVHNGRRDMRSVEIWYQACAYFNEISKQ